MQRLGTPVLPNELQSQPIQQFGMSRPSAGLAEVSQRADDSPPEVVLPDAVDHDPGRKGMVGAHQPAGQGQAAAGLLRSLPGGRDRQQRMSPGQDRRHSRFHPATGTHGLAPPQDVGRRRAAAIPQGPNQGFGSEFGPEQLDLPGGFLRCLAVVRIDVFQVAESNLQTLFILAGQLLWAGVRSSGGVSSISRRSCRRASGSSASLRLMNLSSTGLAFSLSAACRDSISPLILLLWASRLELSSWSRKGFAAGVKKGSSRVSLASMGRLGSSVMAGAASRARRRPL